MSKFIRDMARMAGLEAQKIAWETLAFVMLLLASMPRMHEPVGPSVIDGPSGIVAAAGIWLAVRMYWPYHAARRREYELMVPCSTGVREAARLLILMVSVGLIFGLWAALLYDKNYDRVLCWLAAHLETSNSIQQYLSKTPINVYATHICLGAAAIAYLTLSVALALKVTRWRRFVAWVAFAMVPGDILFVQVRSSILLRPSTMCAASVLFAVVLLWPQRRIA